MRERLDDGIVQIEGESKTMAKKRECGGCGKEVEVPDDLEDWVPVFCSKECRYREAGF